MKHSIAVLLTWSLALAHLPVSSIAQETQQLSRTTYTYKSVDALKIQADVYRPQDTVKRTVVLWLHGGALIMGTRSGVPKQLRDLAEDQGYILVSLDYRLAPEAQLPQIIEDVQDGITWIRETGPKLFNVDPSRLVVAGASAGGYLALMTGNMEPAPTAIVSYWGFGDVDGDWTTKPNAAYGGKAIEKEDAWAGVGARVLTSTNQQNGRARSKFFVYLKQTGRWINAVSGLDPDQHREKLTPFCPIRNVTADYPPTLFLHGTADKDVPVEQSTAMNAELKRRGVSSQLITIDGGGHGLWGGDRELIDQAFKQSMDFIREHLSKN